MKSIVFKNNKTLEINKPVSGLLVVVRSGVSASVVLKGLVKDIRVKVNSKASFHLVNLVKAVNKSDCKAVIELVGIGAKARVSGLFHGKSDDSHVFNVITHHRAYKTKGDILIRGVYEDKAKGVFSGLIKIDPKAKGTDSYFTNNNLLLDKASVISVPRMEIETNNVKASHGSTTSKIDEYQLFYLISRGITRTKAKRMMINAFFQPVLNRLPG